MVAANRRRRSNCVTASAHSMFRVAAFFAFVAFLYLLDFSSTTNIGAAAAPIIDTKYYDPNDPKYKINHNIDPNSVLSPPRRLSRGMSSPELGQHESDLAKRREDVTGDTDRKARHAAATAGLAGGIVKAAADPASAVKDIVGGVASGYAGEKVQQNKNVKKLKGAVMGNGFIKSVANLVGAGDTSMKKKDGLLKSVVKGAVKGSATGAVAGLVTGPGAPIAAVVGAVAGGASAAVQHQLDKKNAQAKPRPTFQRSNSMPNPSGQQKSAKPSYGEPGNLPKSSATTTIKRTAVDGRKTARKAWGGLLNAAHNAKVKFQSKKKT
ncbi:hypothetical protein HK405_009667 [Cladochytrium tenue]|nr:hypothetical protein HK405_009667 [Cladochytrium tenue]